MAWILRVDTPLPTWGEPERLAYQAKHLRLNVAVNVIEGAFFHLGMSFAAANTVIPLFISKLTQSYWPVGMVNMLTNSGWLLPQLFTSNFVERLPRKKPIVAYLGILTERLPTLLFPLCALLALRSPWAALVTFVFAYAWHKLGSGLIATAWQDMLANCFPPNVRTWLLALMVIIGSGIGLACAEPCARLLESLAFPYNFAVCFALLAVGVNVSGIIICFTREPVDPVRKDRQSHGAFLRELPVHLRRDRNLRNCLIARVLGVCGTMSLGFIAVVSIARWDLADKTAAWYTAWMMAGQMLGNLICAAYSTRNGHKGALVLGWSCAALAYAIALVAPGPQWIGPVFLLVGMTGGFEFVSAMLLVMELATPERRATYTGLVNTAIGLVGLLSPMLGAALAHSNPRLMYSLSALAYAAAALTLGFGVAEPRRAAHAVEAAMPDGTRGESDE